MIVGAPNERPRGLLYTYINLFLFLFIFPLVRLQYSKWGCQRPTAAAVGVQPQGALR